MKGSMWRNMGSRASKKRKKKKNHHLYAAIVLVLGTIIITLGIVLLFYIQEIQVTGNQYCRSQEIIDCVQNDKASTNAIYVKIKYALGRGKKPACLDTMEVHMKNPWTLKVTVKEKQVVGYVKNKKTYLWLDKEGLVVSKENEAPAEVPRIEGFKLKQKKRYEQLRTSNAAIFSKALDACEESLKYGLETKKITLEGHQLYMYLGNVRACIGTSVSSEKIAQIKPIMEKLGEKAGTLHLESYSEDNTAITFDEEEISKEN